MLRSHDVNKHKLQMNCEIFQKNGKLLCSAHDKPAVTSYKRHHWSSRPSEGNRETNSAIWDYIGRNIGVMLKTEFNLDLV